MQLSVSQGGAVSAIAGASYTFTAADNGVHVFMVTLTTSGAGHVIQASDGSTSNNSGAFNVAP